MRTLIFTISMAIASSLSSQIIAVENIPNKNVRAVRTTPNRGLIYVSDARNDEVSFYDADYNITSTLILPELPSGYFYEDHVCLVTENLFDNDPTSLEFVVILGSSQSPGMRVLRDDGTILLEELNRAPARYWNNGLQEDLSNVVFQAADGFTYMLVSGQDGQSYSTVVYRLPGTLPCVACDGTTSGLIENTPQDSFNLFVYPNPNRGHFTVEMELAGLVGMQVFDARGALVHNEVFTTSGSRTQRTLDLSAFAKGSYTLLVEHDGQRVSQTVVVE